MIKPYLPGFSAVELMISLFVAALFLVAGHQLYAVVINDSGEARQRAVASDLAEQYLDKYTASASAPCSAGTKLNGAVTPTPENLVNAKVKVVASCPSADTPNLTKVVVTLSYDYKTTEEVTHARLVAK